MSGVRIISIENAQKVLIDFRQKVSEVDLDDMVWRSLNQPGTAQTEILIKVFQVFYTKLYSLNKELTCYSN